MIDLKDFEYDELIEYLYPSARRNSEPSRFFHGFIKAWKAMMK